jgi:hypothetical protein
MADPLERFSKPPEAVAQPNTDVAGTPPATEQTPSTETSTPTPQAEQVQPQTTTETKPDEFIQTLNTRFGTQFKAENEVKDIFGLPQKIAGLESELTKTKDYASKIENYEKQIENFRNNPNADLLGKPLIRQAFIAQQLKDKFPDKDENALREIAMGDVSKMSDLQVLVKNQKIDLPNLSESDIELALKDKYGIDPDTKPEEWSSIAKTKIAIDAQGARANIKTLTSGIEFPKAVTKEQRDADAATALQKRVQETEPLKAEFTSFDKFKKGDIDYDVPADFKTKLPDMFQAMFIDAGLEPTPENKATAMELRDMTFLYQNIDKIIEVKVKEGQTEIQKKLDEALNNTKPPNTATATDEGSPQDNRRGLGAFLEDMKTH